MKKENGITVISLVITVVVLSILSAVSIKAVIDDNILQQKDKINNDFKETMQNTNDKIKSEKEKWNGII